MPVTIVTGAPFSGKGAFVRDEIARREQAGELGIVSVDYTAIFSAITPGELSSFRDEAVADTGAPRLSSYVFAVLVTALLDRELDGYVAVPSPRRALEIADRADADIVDVSAHVEDIADRMVKHMADLRRTVPRATRERSIGRCRKAGAAYLRDEHLLVGRARSAIKRRDVWKVGQPKPPFDRVSFSRGLTARGRAVRDELIEAGNTDWTPADILSELVTERRIGAR